MTATSSWSSRGRRGVEPCNIMHDITIHGWQKHQDKTKQYAHKKTINTKRHKKLCEEPRNLHCRRRLCLFFSLEVETPSFHDPTLLSPRWRWSSIYRELGRPRRCPLESGEFEPQTNDLNQIIAPFKSQHNRLTIQTAKIRGPSLLAGEISPYPTVLIVCAVK